MSQVVEAVVEDLYVEKTTHHPEVFRVCKSRNQTLSAVELRRTVSKISSETHLELKRIGSEKAALNRDLHRLLLDKAVYSRSDVTSNIINKGRRKSVELEDVQLPSEKSRSELGQGRRQLGRGKSYSDNLTEFITHSRGTKANNLKKGTAISEEKLNTLSDLRQYQFWEGDPGAINSIRRGLKPRSVQMTDLLYSRSRRFDHTNRDLELRKDPKGSRLSRQKTKEFRPAIHRTRTENQSPADVLETINQGAAGESETSNQSAAGVLETIPKPE